jgi:hypothetical protein
MTSHRVYPQNDSGVARNLQAKFAGLAWIGAAVGEPTRNTHTDPQTFGFIDKMMKRKRWINQTDSVLLSEVEF